MEELRCIPSMPSCFLFVACIMMYLLGTLYQTSIEFSFHTFCISFYILGCALVANEPFILTIYMFLIGITHHYLFLSFDFLDGDFVKETMTVTFIVFLILGYLEYKFEKLSTLKGFIFSTLIIPVVIKLLKIFLWYKWINVKFTFITVTIFSYFFFLTRNLFDYNKTYYNIFLMLIWFLISKSVTFLRYENKNYAL